MTHHPLTRSFATLLVLACMAVATFGQATVIGTGCSLNGSSVPTVGVTGVPIQGQTFSIDFQTDPGSGSFLVLFGLDNQTYGVQTLPWELSTVGMPGCHLYVDPLGAEAVNSNSQGRLSVTVAGWPAGLPIYVQAIVVDANGLPAGMTNGLEIKPMIPPMTGTPPTISQVTSTGGGIGDTVAIAGPSLIDTTTTNAADILLRGPGTRGFLGRANQVLGTAIIGEIESISRFAESSPLLVHVGQGTEFPALNLPGATTTEPIWAWSSPPGSTPITAPNMIALEGVSTFGNCDAFENLSTLYRIDIQPELDNNVLKFKLPRVSANVTQPLCSSDQLTFNLSFELQDGTMVAASMSNIAPMSTSWNVVGSTVVAWMSSALAMAAPSESFIVNFINGDICIQNLSTNPITSVDFVSSLVIRMNPDDHTVVTECGGIDDDYTGGTEATTPDPAFDAYCNTRFIFAHHQHRSYDEGGSDRFFWDTFDFDGPGAIRAACLEIRIKGHSAQTFTDFIVLGWTGVAPDSVEDHFDWNMSLNCIDEEGSSWAVGDDVVLRFDLSQLPVFTNCPNSSISTAMPILTGTSSILHTLQDGRLEILVQDDTQVDYAKIRVLRCQP